MVVFSRRSSDKYSKSCTIDTIDVVKQTKIYTEQYYSLQGLTTMSDTTQKQIKVFVTTYAEFSASKDFKRGDWFDISDYVNRDAFMKAAQEFVDAEFDGSKEVYLPNYEANFQAGEYVGFNTISESAWDAIK